MMGQNYNGCITLTLKEVLDKELQKQCKSTRVVISNSGLKFTL